VKSRGARRIVAGKAGELYYTEDHYKSFRRVRE
jgi:ribonuclease T1